MNGAIESTTSPTNENDDLVQAIGALQEGGCGKRKPKRQRNPDAFFLSAEDVGYMIGMQEVDVRELMKSGLIRAYRVKSRLKTTRQDVYDFLERLRQEGVGLANVVVVHVPKKALPAATARQERSSQNAKQGAESTNRSPAAAEEPFVRRYLVLKTPNKPKRSRGAPLSIRSSDKQNPDEQSPTTT